MCSHLLFCTTAAWYDWFCTGLGHCDLWYPSVGDQLHNLINSLDYLWLVFSRLINSYYCAYCALGHSSIHSRLLRRWVLNPLVTTSLTTTTLFELFLYCIVFVCICAQSVWYLILPGIKRIIVTTFLSPFNWQNLNPPVHHEAFETKVKKCLTS